MCKKTYDPKDIYDSNQKIFAENTQIHQRILFKKEIPTKVAIYFHDLKEKEVSDLKEILLFFTNRGYKFVNLNDLNKKLGSSEKLISITFDDGFSSWSESLALFEKFNAQATFFINTIMFTNESKKHF